MFVEKHWNGRSVIINTVLRSVVVYQNAKIFYMENIVKNNVFNAVVIYSNHAIIITSFVV